MEPPAEVLTSYTALTGRSPFWSHDVGGFFPATPRALYLRWLPLGVFTSDAVYVGAGRGELARRPSPAPSFVLRVSARSRRLERRRRISVRLRYPGRFAVR